MWEELAPNDERVGYKPWKIFKNEQVVNNGEFYGGEFDTLLG